METARVAAGAISPVFLRETVMTRYIGSGAVITTILVCRVYTIKHGGKWLTTKRTDRIFVVGNCQVDWYCNGAYPVRDGQDIKKMFNEGIYGRAGCKACGM